MLRYIRGEQISHTSFLFSSPSSLLPQSTVNKARQNCQINPTSELNQSLHCNLQQQDEFLKDPLFGALIADAVTIALPFAAPEAPQ
jgi:hypothetical protein